MTYRLAVLGGGAWGTALAVASMRAGLDVRLWARDPESVAELRYGENPRYLKGLRFPPIHAGGDAAGVLEGADCVLLAVPAQALRGALTEIAASVPKGVPAVLCAKGIESATGALLSDIVAEHLPENPIAALSGPSFATDLVRDLPTAVVVAAAEESLAAALAARFSAGHFRCYSSGDLVGVELGGALKNVFAIAAGAVAGAGLGASAQAALVTRGFVELRRLGEAFGADPLTVMGLSGLGDLILTCASSQSRNFAYGHALGRGEPLAGLPLAEGAATAGIAARIARERGVDAPIIASTAAILDGAITVREAVSMLMARPLKPETD